jgi:hypothetical protein
MPVELSDLMQLALEQRPHLFVGNLPRPVAEIFNCNHGVVYLGKSEFKHIAEKHPEMRREEFQSIPLIFPSAAYYLDDKRPNCLTVLGRVPGEADLYNIGIKSVQSGSELWVQTMYKIAAKKAERRVKSLRHIHGLCIP